MLAQRKVSKNILNTLNKVAMVNPLSNAKFAAAIVKNNKIISIGMNSKKSHPLQAKYAKNPHAVFLHAEIDAIKNALREINVDEFYKTDLYICRIKKEKRLASNYVWGLAKPCCGCERAILSFGIRRVIYTTNSCDHQVIDYNV